MEFKTGFYGFLGIVYLSGYIVSFRRFVRSEKDYNSGWQLVFLGLYFSIISWLAVFIFWCFDTDSKPPNWLIPKDGNKSKK